MKISNLDLTPTHQEVFGKLKKALVESIKLSYLLTNDPFYVSTDASKVAISAVLFQVRDNESFIRSLSSRKLTSTESRYSAYIGEMLAVKYALEKFRVYLFGRKFMLFCNNQAIEALN